MDVWTSRTPSQKTSLAEPAVACDQPCRQIGPVQEIVTGRYGRLRVQTTDGRSYDRHSGRCPECSAICHVVVRDELISELTGTPSPAGPITQLYPCIEALHRNVAAPHQDNCVVTTSSNLVYVA